MSKDFTPREIGQIVTAYTGMVCGDFSAAHEYIEKIMKRPVYTHEMGDKKTWVEIKIKAKPDFLKLAKWCSE